MTVPGKWLIATDTGGTFTDCIAVDPQGQTARVKVLSSSRLRGTLTGRAGPRQFHFTHNWSVRSDIFAGYEFLLTAVRDGNTPPGSIHVESIDFQNNIITLDHDLPGLAHSLFTQSVFFEITAHEEAPVLAARLVTATPLDKPLPPLEMRLGTTKGTNALLERKGAPTALLITQGFADLPAIGTQQRPHLFQLAIPAPELLHTHAIEVRERLDAAGNVLQPLTHKELKRIVAAVRQSGVQSVAVALLHAWRNPAHELKIRETLAAAGIRHVSLSHELMPAIKLLPRAQTALVDAYLSPVLQSYIHHISKTLGAVEASSPANSPLHIMTSAGGLVQAGHFSPKDSLLSGPAGGVAGTAAIARLLGIPKVIGFDMGGTSTDAARYDGSFDYAYTTRIGQIEMLSPCLSIETVAAGGGSICWFDGNKLCVGPESAGASPGPACYGAGGPLAITDINLLLGKLDPTAMGIPVSRERAAEALRALRDAIFTKTNIRYTETELLRGFEKIADEKMAEAIRKISVAKGFDPKEYALLAFGGAGGLHACKIADLLGIRTVVLPFDGGLLSAFGIGQALVERFAHRQVLSKWKDCGADLPTLVGSLIEEACAQLAREGFTEKETFVKSRLVYLRFQGQDSCLELDYPPPSGSTLETVFEKKYRRQFGHYPADRQLEVESIKVVVAGRRSSSRSQNADEQDQGFASQFVSDGHPTGLFPESETSRPAPYGQPNTRIVFWEKLRPGDKLEGPAILLNPHSTAYLDADWQLEAAIGQNLVLTPKASIGDSPQLAREPIRQTPDLPVSQSPIELELFTNRFTGIAEEMGAQLQRTAFSVNIKERLDFSCAVLDADAELLVNAPHIPVHLGSLGICTRLVKEKTPLGPGDVVITNHPKYGGSHLPDVTLIRAVYAGEETAASPGSALPLIGYVVNRAHHAELGGKRPGSMPPDAVALSEEGVVIPPVYLVKNGAVQWQVVRDLLTNAPYPTRSLAENLADINAALASLRTGAEKLQALVAEHGLEKVRFYMAGLKESAAGALADALRPYAGRRFSAREKMDDGRPLATRITVGDIGDGGRMRIDFSGTGAAHPFNLNANVSIVYSAVMYVLRLLCDKDIPLNEGLMRQVEIELPPGTFLHPGFEDDPARCPAVVGGNTEVSQRLVDTLLKAFAPVTKAACSQGTMNNFLFGNDRFGYYETIGGGAGACEHADGRSAVHQHMTNTKITDPEELELRYPVRLRRFSIRKNSGGKGRRRGGNGIVREFEFLEDVEMTFIGQHRSTAPYGLEGGKRGMRGRQCLRRADGTKEMLKGTDSRPVRKGDRLTIETPGGGGWGNSAGAAPTLLNCPLTGMFLCRMAGTACKN